MVNITPLIILIIIDLLGVNKLWNERLERRLLHHILSSNYNSHKEPVIYTIDNMLSKHQIDTVLNLQLPEINGINTNMSTIEAPTLIQKPANL